MDIKEWVVKKIHSRVYRKYICPHCEGKGKIWVTIYPASGAELEEHICGVCKGKGKVDLILLRDILPLITDLKEKLDICKKMYAQKDKDYDTLFIRYKEIEDSIQKYAEDRLSICRDVGGERKEYVDAKNALELNAISIKENLLRLAIWEKDGKKLLAILLKEGLVAKKKRSVK